MNVEVLRDLIKKCDIYFEDQLISGELLLRVFTDFLSEEADRQENKGSIILHTASPCFDAIAVAWSALAVIAGNGADVESIIRMLQPGERVLCGKERGEFIGIETDENGKEWAVIRQGKSSIRKIGRKGCDGRPVRSTGHRHRLHAGTGGSQRHPPSASSCGKSPGAGGKGRQAADAVGAAAGFDAGHCVMVTI